ncbi:MAG TPA: branched-chain amino acid ABC transporter permease [Solirubrobacterales bacterium]|nr:branched-chain amino acid ABC transporter permease [Solirubrobacterales bacterium]
MIAGALPLAVSFDFLTAWDFWIGVFIIAGVYGVFTLGLQINVGYTGIINFGQAGFMALGAYATIVFTVTLGMPMLVGLLLATLVTIAAGLLIGLPSLRLRADYFAIATIAFAEIIRLTGQNARGLTGGNQGTISIELEQERFFIDGWTTVSRSIEDNVLDPIGLGASEFSNLPLLALIWITLIVLVIVLNRLIASPWGRVLRAIREDEDAARALGKNAFAYKLQSLTIASTLGALSGFFILLQLQTVNQDVFQPLVTFVGYAILVLGGLASFAGVMVGAVILWTVLEGMRFLDLPLGADKIAAMRFIFVGLILILLMAFRPQGALGKREEMVLGE